MSKAKRTPLAFLTYAEGITFLNLSYPAVSHNYKLTGSFPTLNFLQKYSMPKVALYPSVKASLVILSIREV
jgi:hypothetical protein